MAGGRHDWFFCRENFKVKIGTVDFRTAAATVQMGQICRGGHVVLSLAEGANEKQHLGLFVNEEEQKVVIHEITEKLGL